MNPQFIQWCQEHLIVFKVIEENVMEIGDKKYILLKGDGDHQVDFNFEIIASDQEKGYSNEFQVDYYVFLFGDEYYYSSRTKTEMIPFRYVGNAQREIDIDFCYLGIHGGYELLNGSRDYSDWCKKAKFLGYNTLGICEKNTLAGTLAFQIACKGAGIKSILGETVTVRLDDKESFYQVKLYVIDKKGWNNLLHVNKHINVDNEGFILEKDLFALSNGLVCVLTESTPMSMSIISKYRNAFILNLYFQFDSVEYLGNDRDKTYLTNMQNYIKNYSKIIKPILINDSYYIDQCDSHIKKMLNKIDSGKSHEQSNNQYLKPLDDNYITLSSLFTKEEKCMDLFEEMIDNANSLKDLCNYTIETGKFHLPKYELTLEQSEHFNDNEELFMSIIEDALISRGLSENEDYLERIETELEVIKEGNLIDYFLILWDIIKWCNEQGILVGIGRGSSSGSLISFLLGVVKIDPIKYGLLFERFLNKSRIHKSMADIDSDVCGERRDEVKRYMEERFGINHVASVGTYTTMKLKAALKDLGRLSAVDIKLLNYITSLLDTDGNDWKEIFKIGLHKTALYDFIQSHTQLIKDIQLCINQQRSSSVHPSAVVIVPKVDNDGNPMTIFDWMPVKKMDGLLVIEWEGEYVEKAGFLKEDILGIRQLDKFASILKLIKENTGDEIELETIPLDDDNVYHLFQQGYNGDVFHFGSKGLTQYSQQVLPSNIEELIAMIALYRPGAMDSGSHNTYVDIKFGKKTASYDYMLEEVTKETYGLYVYQEQVIKAVQVLGGFSLSEADNARRAMGKKIQSEMDQLGKKFLEGAISKGCSEQEAKEIWDKLQVFANYGFNLSHAAAYAITGYHCQWFKYHYPVEYWTTTLQFAKEEEMAPYIAEIKKLKNHLEILPVDINKSQESFYSDFKEKKIYWSIAKIKWVGDIAVTEVLKEREENGLFYSLEDFIDRVEKRKVNKRCVLHLILCGAFDIMEKVKNIKDRLYVVEKYFKLLGKDIDEVFLDKNLINKEYWWTIQQTKLSGFGMLDYQEIVSNSSLKNCAPYRDPIQFFAMRDKEPATIAGTVINMAERETKNGDVYGRLYLENNGESLEIFIWNETYVQFRDQIKSSKDKIAVINGIVSGPNRFSTINKFQTDGDSKLEFL